MTMTKILWSILGYRGPSSSEILDMLHNGVKAPDDQGSPARSWVLVIVSRAHRGAPTLSGAGLRSRGKPSFGGGQQILVLGVGLVDNKKLSALNCSLF